MSTRHNAPYSSLALASDRVSTRSAAKGVSAPPGYWGGLGGHPGATGGNGGLTASKEARAGGGGGGGVGFENEEGEDDDEELLYSAVCARINFEGFGVAATQGRGLLVGGSIRMNLSNLIASFEGKCAKLNTYILGC